MNINQTAAAMNVVPLLSRIVLGLFLFLAGLNQVAFQDTFTSKRATTLRKLGVSSAQAPSGIVSTTRLASAGRDARKTSRGGRRGVVNAAKVHHVTLALESQGWSWYPNWFAWAAAGLEILAALFLLAGFFTRVSSGVVIALLLTAVVLTVLSVIPGFSMASLGFDTLYLFAAQTAAIAMAVGLLLTGAGNYSVDAVWRRRRGI